MSVLIRETRPSDQDDIWAVLQPILRAGETYALPVHWERTEALAYWLKPENKVFVAALNGKVIGTYYLHGNQLGGGSHVANCGFATAPEAQGRGIASRMCEHSLKVAASLGYRAMQFNFVISTNERAVRLWQRFGFAVVGTLPGAFNHPRFGYVDAFVMFRTLAPG
jgi:ribosomal protein S18 acetylase RimI-like enzyme